MCDLLYVNYTFIKQKKYSPQGMTYAINILFKLKSGMHIHDKFCSFVFMSDSCNNDTVLSGCKIFCDAFSKNFPLLFFKMEQELKDT